MKMRKLFDIYDTYCLKGVAMLMIIVSHTFNGYPVESSDVYYPLWMDWLHIDLWGGMGVAVFLFLSGYGLFTSLSKRQGFDKKYLASKGRRLFEPYIIYWMVEIIVLAIFCREDLSMHLFTEMATFSVHPDVDNWFFKVIVGIYFLMLLLFRLRLSDAVRVAVIAIFCCFFLFTMKELGFGQHWWNTILCFPSGALMAYRYDFFSSLSSRVVCLTAGLLLLMVSCIHMNTVVFHLLFSVFSIYAVSLINIRSRVLHYIGVNSFIFYFIECPVENHIVMFSYFNFPVYSILSVVVTFILSYLCVATRNRCGAFINNQ